MKNLVISGYQNNFPLSQSAVAPLPNKVLFPAVTLMMLQIADAFLTAMGVARFGLESEGNPLLRSMMSSYGHIPVLLVVKCLAILAIFLLVRRANEITWIPQALGAMSCFYLLAAIFPWTYILIVAPLL